MNKKEFKKYKKNLERTIKAILPLIIITTGISLLLSGKLSFYGFQFIEIKDWGIPDL